MGIEEDDKAAAKVATAPRITLQFIESEIMGTFYTTAEDVMRSGDGTFDTPDDDPEKVYRAGRVVTVCILVMRNGFVVIGKSAPISAANYNRPLGLRFAYEDAVRQLWPLMAFHAKQTMHNEDRAFGQPHKGHSESAP